MLKRVREKKYNFVYGQDLIDYISKVGFDETFGARPIKRAIQDKIEDLISEKILMMEIEENKDYQLKVDNDEVVVSSKEEKPKRGRKPAAPKKDKVVKEGQEPEKLNSKK